MNKKAIFNISLMLTGIYTCQIFLFQAIQIKTKKEIYLDSTKITIQTPSRELEYIPFIGLLGMILHINYQLKGTRNVIISQDGKILAENYSDT